MPETEESKSSRRNSKYSTIVMQKDRSCFGRMKLRNSLAKETLSEFFGTCLLITLGCSCVASSVLSDGKSGGFLTNNLGFAMAVTMAIYATGGVSGGHINPAVSFAMCLTGRLEWVKFPFYVSAQFLGAITGSALVFGVYHDALIRYTGGVLTVYGSNATAHIFATYPAPYLSTVNGLADQILSTALLLIMVFAIFDKKNIAAPKGLEPIAVGLLILLLGLSLGTNSGGAMNPARDLGPRIFTAAAGWGYEVFTYCTKKPFTTFSSIASYTSSRVQQLVQMLHLRCATCSGRYQLPQSQKKKVLSQENVTHLLERLTKNSAERAPDSKRIAQGKLCQMGVVNSYAWKGWN